MLVDKMIYLKSCEAERTVPLSKPNDFTNLNLTWKNITYKTKKKNADHSWKSIFWGHDVKYVQLLHNVSGIAKSGTLIALLGPSGAGKTTFLTAISRRIKGSAGGDVFLNGKNVDQETMTRVSEFVPQQDLAINTLTVQEHMEFMGSMKMDRRIKPTERKKRIIVLLNELGLVECRNTKLSILSGGEKKKVSLAAQLLTEPGILFCDEPTTGLDSYSSMSVIRTLRELTKSGRIVICAIHQPASGVLDLFHEVILLSAGKVAFQGSTASAMKFFDSLGLHCPMTYNKAEFYITQLSIYRDRERESYEKVQWICDEFENSKYGKKIVEMVDKTSCTSDELSVGEFEKICFLSQIYWLVWRIYIDSKRSSSVLLINFLLYMLPLVDTRGILPRSDRRIVFVIEQVIATVLATPYVNLTKNLNQNSIQNMQGLLYLVVTETIFTFHYSVFNTFPKELPHLLRDVANGLYQPAPYYISKVLFSIPGAVFKAFSYTLLIFVVVGLHGGIFGFVMFVLPVILCALSSSAIGHLMSATFESITTASLLSVPIDFLTLIYSGIFLHLGDSSVPLSWLKYVSQFYYGTEAISLTQWSRIKQIDCSSGSEEPCISNGLEVLEKYGYEYDDYFLDIFGLLTIFFICHFVGFLAIRIRSQKEAVY